jgi:hypothetical protein
MNRPIRSIAVLGALTIAGLAWQTQARAAEATLCARPDVLSYAKEHLRSQDAHLHLLESSVGEVATAQPNRVFCVVSVRVETFDLGAYRDNPAVLVEPRYFEVRRLRDGFEVDFTGR